MMSPSCNPHRWAAPDQSHSPRQWASLDQAPVVFTIIHSIDLNCSCLLGEQHATAIKHCWPHTHSCIDPPTSPHIHAVHLYFKLFYQQDVHKAMRQYRTVALQSA